jgi:hypothetical protein
LFVKRFFEEFSTFFLGLVAVRKTTNLRANSRDFTEELLPLIDKGIIAHPVVDCNRQPVQFWEK